MGKGSNGHAMHLADAADFFELADHLGARRGVEREDGQRLAALLVAAERHVSDVHLVLAEDGAVAGDHAGAVDVFDEEQRAFGIRFDAAAVHLHDARRTGEEGARDAGSFAGVILGDDFDEIAELTGLNLAQVKVYIYRGRTALKDYIGQLDLIL